jgi:hypothetical protein
MYIEEEDGIKLDVYELDGEVLDYYAAKARGFEAFISHNMRSCLVKIAKDKETRWTKFNPSTYWTHGGPLIELESITIEFQGMIGDQNYWMAYYGVEPSKNNKSAIDGPTPLVAAMRCLVKNRYGPVIDPTKDPTLEEK